MWYLGGKLQVIMANPGNNLCVSACVNLLLTLIFGSYSICISATVIVLVEMLADTEVL